MIDMRKVLIELDGMLGCQREYMELADGFQKQADQMRERARQLQMKINGVRNTIKDELEKK